MNPTIEKIWKFLPKFLQDFIASTVDKIAGNAVPSPPTADESKPIRLFIAPANYAGQGYRWARAVETNPLVSARNMVYAEINPFGFAVDFPVRWRTVTHSRRWQRNQLLALTTDFTHVLVEAQFPPLGGMFHEDVLKQVTALRSRGTKVAMLCHGSDIRLPSRHRELEQWSPFVNDDWVPVEKLEVVMLKNRRLLDVVNAPTFVSTPGLLLDVPYAHFLPVVIEPAFWQTQNEIFTSPQLKVVHIPSNPLVKGTAEILDAMLRLEQAGIIEYTQIVGVSHEQMPEIYGNCDIVLDQFRLGDYGVAACEAMAAGRIVVSHVSDQAREVVKQQTGIELPIVEANIDNLESVLLEISAHRDLYRKHASLGPAFVNAIHNGQYSRKVLEAHFLFAPVDARSPQGEQE